MCRLIVKGRVFEIFEKEDRAYVTMNDTETGGLLKLQLPANTNVKLDTLLVLDAEIKPGIGQYGQFLKVVKLNKEGGN